MCSAVSREDLKKRMMDPVGPNTVFLPFLVYHCVSFLKINVFIWNVKGDAPQNAGNVISQILN
jgi:hypothetical protein